VRPQALSGETYRLIFKGRRNGGPRPDFRDAAPEADDGAQLLGAVELHLRARDWLAHGRHADARYNGVILHLAFDATSSFSPLARGRSAPIVCPSFTQAAVMAPPDWPYANLYACIGPVGLRALLLWAGTERFEQRVRAFAEALSCGAADTCDTSASCWTVADRRLWAALAEALADRKGHTAFAERARAAYLEAPRLPSNQITREMTRQLGFTAHPSGVAAQQGLHHLWTNWRQAQDCARCPANPHRARPNAL
jgi:hypothetical protein